MFGVGVDVKNEFPIKECVAEGSSFVLIVGKVEIRNCTISILAVDLDERVYDES